MTNQEAFDTIVRHLRNQGRQAIDGEGACCYRTQDGLKCAVGCLIPDDKYGTDIEGKSVTILPRTSLGLEDVSCSLLEYLQHTHDVHFHSGFTPEVKGHLRLLARTYNLNESVIDE